MITMLSQPDKYARASCSLWNTFDALCGPLQAAHSPFSSSVIIATPVRFCVAMACKAASRALMLLFVFIPPFFQFTQLLQNVGLFAEL